MVGWAGSRPGSFDAGEHAVGSIRRIPLDGLATVRARALALVPRGLDASAPVEVLCHLHGLGITYEDHGGGVRDVDVDRLAQQLEAAARPMILLAPQGTPASDFNPAADPARPAANQLASHDNPAVSIDPKLPARFVAQPDKGFDVQAFVDEALGALAALGILGRAPEVATAVLSAHSGGGDALSLVLAEDGIGRRPRALGAIVLFDAVNGDEELSRLLSFLDAALRRDADAIASAGDADAQLAALARGTLFRAITTGAPFYAARHHALDAFLSRWFEAHADAAGDEVTAAWRARYRVVFSDHRDHETLVGSGALEDALRALPPVPSPASA